MIAYEVTATVAASIADEVVAWLRDVHVPDVLATGCFVRATLARAADGRVRVRYEAPDALALARYVAGHAPALRAATMARFPDGVAFVRDEWEQVTAWHAPGLALAAAHDGAPAAHVGRVVETALYVGDVAVAHRFYAGLLGAPALLDTARLVALDVAGTSVLLLFQRGATTEPLDTPGGTVPPHGARGAQHLAFAVPASDVAAWSERLAALAIPLESRVRWPRGGESLYFRDPDGHSVELITPGLWATY